MKLPEILRSFHMMPTCDRLDLICRLLRGCVPYELRFLGTVILDATRAEMKSFAATETTANQVNHYAGFKDSGLTHAVCEKLCCALAVVHAHNHPVAEAVFGLLDNPQALQLYDETTDLKVADDIRLLYVMATHHPALSYNQRQHLLYTYLQRMDALYDKKCKLNRTRNMSSSVESSGDGETGGTLRREPDREAYMTYCDVHSVYKRQPDKRYAYMIQVEWSDGTALCVRRTYGDFFSFHTKLLDLFPEEGGQKHKKERMIPFLPGKSYPRLLTNRNNRDLAEKRLPELHRYAKELLSLPERISQCHHVRDFFRPRPEDLREEYPSVDRITTLYDLVESGKARLRNYTDPLVSKGSPTRVQRSSPLHRASGESRTSHTLPHQSTSSTAQNKEESVLERRFTYPSRHSAFKPVTPPQHHQTPPTSTHLTNSQPHIANGGSPSAATETATLETVAASTASLLTSSSSVTNLTTSQPIAHSTSSTISIISSSHLHTSHPSILPNSTISTTSQYHTASNVVSKPTPAYAHYHQQHSITTVTPPTKPLAMSHITHPHIHHPPVTSSPPPPIQSGKTTPIGEVSYSIPLPVGPPIPVFNPIIIGYGSPMHSPSPSPLTPGLRGKSSGNISRTPTEYDSLTRWLKVHRLHKYAPIFENMNFDELLLTDKGALKKKGMTEGAAKKLIGLIDELKAQSFTGFRDMPYNPRIHRKPSTCSLPAALLAENRVTPCSSVDGLSPTDSTCSLDKAAARIVSQTSGRQDDLYYPLNGSASQETPSVASYDVAILKAVTAPQNMASTDAVLQSSTLSPPHSTTSLSPPHHLHTISPPSDVQSDSSRSDQVATLTRTSVGGVATEGGVSSSWADRLDAAEDERDASTPEWAQLRRQGSRGRSHTPSLTPKHPPITKRFSAELHDVRSLNDPLPHYHPPHVTPCNPAQATWLHRPLVPVLQNSYPGGHSGGRHRVPYQPVTPVGVNGLVPTYPPSVAMPPVLPRPAYLPGSPVCPPVFTNHNRSTHQPPPPACFNCGKKGHYGTSCPADTMDTHNPDMFHKQLERAITHHQSHRKS